MVDDFRNDDCDRAFVSTLLEIEAEWNEAERYMKAAERYRNELVYTSVNELRYAGRQIMDAIAEYRSGKFCEELRERKFASCLTEVRKICARAKHDSVDATVLYIEDTVRELEATFGSAFLAKHAEDYGPIKRNLAIVNRLIEDARKDRTLRDQNYEVILRDHFETIRRHHQNLTCDEEVLRSLYDQHQEDNRSKFDWKNAWGPALLGVIATLVVGGLGLWATRSVPEATQAQAAPLEEELSDQ